MCVKRQNRGIEGKLILGCCRCLWIPYIMSQGPPFLASCASSSPLLRRVWSEDQLMSRAGSFLVSRLRMVCAISYFTK